MCTKEELHTLLTVIIPGCTFLYTSPSRNRIENVTCATGVILSDGEHATFNHPNWDTHWPIRHAGLYYPERLSDFRWPNGESMQKAFTKEDRVLSKIKKLDAAFKNRQEAKKCLKAYSSSTSPVPPVVARTTEGSGQTDMNTVSGVMMGQVRQYERGSSEAYSHTQITLTDNFSFRTTLERR